MKGIMSKECFIWAELFKIYQNYLGSFLKSMIKVMKSNSNTDYIALFFKVLVLEYVKYQKIVFNSCNNSKIVSSILRNHIKEINKSLKKNNL